MTNTALLKDKIRNSGLKQAFIAEKIGISRASLNDKIHNRSEFKQSEIDAISVVLKLTAKEQMQIFFYKTR